MGGMGGVGGGTECCYWLTAYWVIVEKHMRHSILKFRVAGMHVLTLSITWLALSFSFFLFLDFL